MCLLLLLILEFFNIELKWDHNFLEEKSKKWRLKNPQIFFPKLTYYVFLTCLISFFNYPFLNFFSFLWKEIGTYPVYKSLGILKSYSSEHGLGRPARLFRHQAPKRQNLGWDSPACDPTRAPPQDATVAARSSVLSRCPRTDPPLVRVDRPAAVQVLTF